MTRTAGVRLHGKDMRAFTGLALRRRGIQVTSSPWTRFPTFRLAGREVARFYASRGLGLRLTWDVIKQGEALFSADPRMELRPSESPWLRYNLGRSSDVDFALDLLHLAVQANLAGILSDRKLRSVRAPVGLGSTPVRVRPAAERPRRPTTR